MTGLSGTLRADRAFCRTTLQDWQGQVSTTSL
jgi:hypothetical protein